MNPAGSDMIEVFLTEASGHLQFLREYSSILQDPYPSHDDLERLYVAAHTLVGSSGLYGFPLLSEVAAKLAHLFQYTLNAGISAETSGPLIEFIYEGIATLESDLLMISANSIEAEEEIVAFKEKYPFAFQATEQASAADAVVEDGEQPAQEYSIAEGESQNRPGLELDAEVSAEVLEFFVPEVEEHLQVVTECLLSLETSRNSEDIHRLFRAIHTIKGSAAQVGLHRISRVAHRTEDLIGRLREGGLQPSASIVDICLEAVDVLKKLLYSQTSDDEALPSGINALLSRIGRLAPEEQESEEGFTAEAASDGAEPVLAADSEPVAIGAQPAPAAELIVASQEADIDPDADIPSNKKAASSPQSKSVRISLERLDRMMNAVGELVINRTRMLGRVAELERLADVLNFSKARMTDKIGEFQEKYEFNQLPPAPEAACTTRIQPGCAAARLALPIPSLARRVTHFRFAEAIPVTHIPSIQRWQNLANWKWTVTTSSTSCHGR